MTGNFTDLYGGIVVDAVENATAAAAAPNQLPEPKEIVEDPKEPEPTGNVRAITMG